MVRSRRLPRWSMSSTCPLPLPQVEDVADGVDVVLGVEGHPVFGDVLVELAVDPEPADLAQAVAVGVEELLVEQLAGLLELRRVARPQPLVDPQQRALVVGGRVFLERLEDQRVAGLLEDRDLAEVAGVGQDLRRGLGDRGAAVDQDLAGGRVDDVAAGDPALELGGRLGVGRVDRPRPRRTPGGSPRRSEYFGLMARSSVIDENLPDWSIRTPRVSFLVTWSSIQLPRSGMTRQACSFLSLDSISTTKSTPGERWSWLTTTRSAPLMMNSPPPIMIGMSPR